MSRLASDRHRLAFREQESLTVATALWTLPSWLAIACATTGRTSQIAREAIKTGFGANAARARNVGEGWGLSAECARRNKLCGNTDTWLGSATLQAWAVGENTKTTGQADPAGGTGANKWACTTVGLDGAAGSSFTDFASLKTFAAYGSDGVVSMWGRGGVKMTPAQPYGYVCFENDADNLANVPIITENWARYDVYDSRSVGQYVLLDFGQFGGAGTGRGQAAGATAYTWGAQLELGVKYPSSYFPVANAAENQLRAADVLSCPSPSTIMPGGYFDLRFVVSPHYASTETLVDHDLLFVDSNNRLFFRQSDRKLVLKVGGNSIASAALTFNRNYALVVRAKSTATAFSLSVAGAISGNGTTTGSVQSAISLPSTVYVLGNASGSQESADLNGLFVHL